MIEFQTLVDRIESQLASAGCGPVLSDDNVCWGASELANLTQLLGLSIVNYSQKQNLIGVSFSNTAVQALVTLSIIRQGRVPVLLSSIDFQKSPQVWIERSGVVMVMSDTQMSQHALSVPCLIVNGNGQLVESPVGVQPTNIVGKLAPEGTALVLFTSGSTGLPKGICIPAVGLLETIDYLIPYFDINEKTVAPIVLPICHSMALNTQFFPTFFAGGHSHFVNARMSLNRIYRTILAKQSSFVSMISETLQMCFQEQQKRSLPPALSVRHVQLAGGLIASKHTKMAQQLFPNAIIHKGYGLTEAIRVTMIDHKDANFETSSVGFPLPFVKVELRNVDGSIVQEPNTMGEIHVKGPNVLKHIITNENFSLEEDSFFATGDLGYWNEYQQLCVVGRQDGILKINGHRVSTFEIERMAIDFSKTIQNSKCISIDDERRGYKKMVLLLEIPTDFQEEFISNEFENVQKDMALKLQQFSYFPREIAIVNRFPRTSNGKLATVQLAEDYKNAPKNAVLDNKNSALQFYQMNFEVTV